MVVRFLGTLIVGLIILFAIILIFQPNQNFSIISPQQQISQSVRKQVQNTVREYEPVSFEKIFDGKNEDVLARERIVLLATGDVIPARSVNYQASIRNDFLWPYQNIAETVADADLTLINLETPLIKNCPVTQQGMIFCGSERHIEGLKLMGVDIASLANNHAGNYGVAGLEETIQLLEKNEIEATGIRGTGDKSYVVKEVKGIKFGFLGFNDIAGGVEGIVPAQYDLIKSLIAEAREEVDVVIVTYHWGAEYRAQPDRRQIELGHFTIDNGADLVIGNHPHWIQPVEIYNGKVIMYAHGNTIFDQEWSAKTKQGVLGKYIFAGKKLVDIEYIPIGIRNYGEAFIAEEPLKTEILNDLKQQSILLVR